MVGFSTGPTAEERLAQWIPQQEVLMRQKTHGPHAREHWCYRRRVCSSPENAPETRGTVGHLEYKNDIIVNLTLSNRKLLFFLLPVLIRPTYVSETVLGIYVEIFNVYAIQLVVKATVNAITADKLSRRYNDLYLGVTFWDTEY